MSTAFTLKATLIPIHSEVLLILEQHWYTMCYMILVLGKFQCRDKCLCLLTLFSNIPVLWVKIKNQEILQTFYYIFCLYMYLPLIFLLFRSLIHFIQLPLKLMFININCFSIVHKHQVLSCHLKFKICKLINFVGLSFDYSLIWTFIISEWRKLLDGNNLLCIKISCKMKKVGFV